MSRDNNPLILIKARSGSQCRRKVRSRLRRAVAATEFAIVAPVFFMMIIGFIEFGRALMVQQVLINASRVGAREASTTGATLAEVQSTVQDYASAVSVNGVSVSVSPDPASATAGSAITVTTSVPFSNVSWMSTPWFLGGKTLSASSEMRKEGFQ
ncbi:MAG TPA: TadE family protein [Lacipirellulaceae bacterium]|nr:TadE family protein [Lacipirellulaceae bacterium]